MTEVSIIIRTLNESRYLGRLLEQIHCQQVRGLNLETIIVDSGSTDDTLEIARQHGCRILHIRKQDFSFGRSLNVGCDAAAGKYLVLISGHCIPCDRSWLSNLLEPYEASEIGISYGRQVGGPETLFSEQRIFSKYFPDAPEPSQAEFFCNNANASIRKSVWEKYRYDEDLTGLEDMHLAKRAWQDGIRTEYCHLSVVHHLHHESWSQIERRFEREAIALQRIMPEIQLSAFDATYCGISAILNDIKRAAKERVLFSNITSIILYRFSQYWGSFRGHRLHRKLSQQEKMRYFYPVTANRDQYHDFRIQSRSAVADEG